MGTGILRPRTLIIGLVIANLLAYFWWHGDIDALLGSSREPERLRQQQDAERLRVVPLPRLQSGGGDNRKMATDGTAPGGTDLAGQSSATGRPQGGTAEDKGLPAEICIEIGPLEETRSARLRQFLAESRPVVRGELELLNNTGTWMVYTPPSDTSAQAQRKIADYRKLGIQDMYLMPDGPYRLGISFGLFRSEDSARSLAESLIALGLKTARVAPRSASEPKTMFRLRYTLADERSRESARRLTALQGDLGVNPTPCAPAG